MSAIIEQIKNTIIHRNSARKRGVRIIKNRIKPKPFFGSSQYWKNRYAFGGNSGVASYGKFASHTDKAFKLVGEYEGEIADLSLSLDVIYHLVDDEVFEKYMRTLFKAARRYVIIYSSNFDSNSDYKGTHVRHRKFTRWIQHNVNGWKMIDHIPNRYPYKGDYKTGSSADFFIYKKA